MMNISIYYEYISIIYEYIYLGQVIRDSGS